MTRQHAHELVFGKCKNWEGKEVASFLDALEALGLLKFEEVPTIIIEGRCLSMKSVIDAMENKGYKFYKI